MPIYSLACKRWIVDADDKTNIDGSLKRQAFTEHEPILFTSFADVLEYVVTRFNVKDAATPTQGHHNWKWAWSDSVQDSDGSWLECWRTDIHKSSAS